METARSPGFPGNPPARMPRAPTPAKSPPPRPLSSGDVAFRPTQDVGPRKQCISGLNHAAYGLPVNASRPGSPQTHASLGSGWRPTLAGWDWIPTGFRIRFRRLRHVILSPLTGLFPAHASLHETGKRGVIWGELYSAFWQGANNTNPWWHNQIALLIEVASADLASTVVQERADQGRRGSAGAPDDRGRSGDESVTSIPAPTDVQYRMTYPRPWLGGVWSPADVVDYTLTAVYGLIEAVANNRVSLKRNFYTMNRRAIARFTEGPPFAFVIPPDQRDPGAVREARVAAPSRGRGRARPPMRRSPPPTSPTPLAPTSSCWRSRSDAG